MVVSDRTVAGCGVSWPAALGPCGNLRCAVGPAPIVGALSGRDKFRPQPPYGRLGAQFGPKTRALSATRAWDPRVPCSDDPTASPSPPIPRLWRESVTGNGPPSPAAGT